MKNSSPRRAGLFSPHGNDRLDHALEKNHGPVAAESAALLASQPVAGESFNGGCSVCSDCHLDVIPCACCLECGQVQTRRMGEYERCEECQADDEARRYPEPDSNRTLGLGVGGAAY